MKTNQTTSLVVGIAPYAITLSSGAHLSPGELANIELDSFNQGLVDNGKIAVVDVPAFAPPILPVIDEAVDIIAPESQETN